MVDLDPDNIDPLFGPGPVEPANPKKGAESANEDIVQRALQTIAALGEKQKDYGAAPVANTSLTSLNPAHVIAMLATLYEKHNNEKLKKEEELSREHLENNKQFLDLLSKVSALKKDKELPKDVRQQIEELEARGFKLWGHGDYKALEERIGSLRHLINSHIEKERTEIQGSFTKMQTLVQFLTSMLDCVRKALHEQAQLNRKAIEGGSAR